MNKLFSIFDFSVLTGTNRKAHKDSMGQSFQPASATVIPAFNTVLPNGVTQWVGEQGSEFKAWCKKMGVSSTYSRFNPQADKPKIQMEKYVFGD